MLISNQVATAPCTDLVQARGLTFEGKALKELGGPKTPEERTFTNVSELEDELHR